MPKSFVSSLLLRRHISLGALGLIALALLATGCGEAKNIDYSPADVQAAFAAVGVPLYGPRQLIPDSFAQAQQPAPSLRTRPQFLTALLRGVRDALFFPSVHREHRSTVLHGQLMDVFVYPRAEDAQNRARSFADLLGAEQILGRVGFGYAQKGNVVVDYRVFNSSSRVPGFLGAFDSVRAIDRKIRQQITAALSHLR
jgi:hypothetical protein